MSTDVEIALISEPTIEGLQIFPRYERAKLHAKKASRAPF
jgi:hypothetical protein